MSAVQLDPMAHHSSPQSNYTQAVSPVAPIGSLRQLLHGSTSCQKYDGLTWSMTDWTLVRCLACCCLFFFTPSHPLLALENSHSTASLRNNKSHFHAQMSFCCAYSFHISYCYYIYSEHGRIYYTADSQRVNSAGCRPLSLMHRLPFKLY